MEASYTVELALLLPVVLFVLFAPVYLGYHMYGQTKECSVSGWEQDFCAEEKVRNLKLAEHIWKE